ncbi:MAG: hypothetical protein UCH28_01320 [Adlercreutzia sp.]|nr:hypothetical protein [Adlercreutzia sp.]
MMAEDTLTIELDSDLLEELLKLLEENGLDLETVTNAFFAEIARTRAIPAWLECE